MVTTRSYRSDLRADRARATRRRVLAAAATLFPERGYAGTTVRAVAGEAGVSVATVEQLFGTKDRLLHAAVDVAIAGDDEQVAVLDRPWAAEAAEAATPEQLLAGAAAVLAAAMERSAGLVLAAFEGARTEADLVPVARQLSRQRRTTAAWLVDRLAEVAPLREDRDSAAETLWALMEPALYLRLTARRGWTTARYQDWFARSARHLLLPDPPPRG